MRSAGQLWMAALRQVGGRTRGTWALGSATLLLAVAGTCVASARLEMRLRNPDRIPISHPDREPLLGVVFELFTSRSPGGAFHTVMRERIMSTSDQTLLVVDTGTGDVVGRLASAEAGGRLVDHGWPDPTTLWVSVGQFPGECIAAHVAHPPAWEFVPGDCGQRPADAGATRLGHRSPSPDGALVATSRSDRSGPQDFGDGAPPVPDVRIEDRDGRFLAQLGDLNLVGWTTDGNLLVTPDLSARPYAITRAEIDRIVTDD